MIRIGYLIQSLFQWLGFLTIGLLTNSVWAAEFIFRHENILGTSMELHVTALSLEEAREAEAKALSEIDRLNRMFSSHIPDSVISEFSRAPINVPLYVPTEFLELLVACDWWKRKTNGAFNPLIEESSLLWKDGVQSGLIPDEAEISRAVERASHTAWVIDAGFETATRIENVSISLDAIAKGYIIDRACQEAKNVSTGIDSVLLSIGGDLRAIGSIPQKVGITDPANPADNAAPLATLVLTNQSIATSANYERSFEIQGKQYSQIIDPRNGYPVSGIVKSASVISTNATQADALATALMVVSPEEGIALIETLPDTECLLVYEEASFMRSSGFNHFLDKEVRPIKSDLSWRNDFELRVDFEINRPDTRRYERPYIAIWIEDSDGQLVKTLCLWAQLDTNYVKKLSRWIRLKDKDWDRINALSRATRRPGRYRLIWDGTDESGELLPIGTYAIFIEAVREHGTHTLIREQITLGDEPFLQALKGNLEIKSASLHYAPKTD